MRILILLVGLWGTKQFEFFPNHLPTKPITLLTEPIESYLEIKSDLLDREKLENLLQSIKTNGKIILKDLGYPAEFSQFEKNIQDIMDIIVLVFQRIFEIPEVTRTLKKAYKVYQSDDYVDRLEFYDDNLKTISKQNKPRGKRDTGGNKLFLAPFPSVVKGNKLFAEKDYTGCNVESTAGDPNRKTTCIHMYVESLKSPIMSHLGSDLVIFMLRFLKQRAHPFFKTIAKMNTLLSVHVEPNEKPKDALFGFLVKKLKEGPSREQLQIYKSLGYDRENQPKLAVDVSELQLSSSTQGPDSTTSENIVEPPTTVPTILTTMPNYDYDVMSDSSAKPSTETSRTDQTTEETEPEDLIIRMAAGMDKNVDRIQINEGRIRENQAKIRDLENKLGNQENGQEKSGQGNDVILEKIKKLQEKVDDCTKQILHEITDLLAEIKKEINNLWYLLELELASEVAVSVLGDSRKNEFTRFRMKNESLLLIFNRYQSTEDYLFFEKVTFCGFKICIETTENSYLSSNTSLLEIFREEDCEQKDSTYFFCKEKSRSPDCVYFTLQNCTYQVVGNMRRDNIHLYLNRYAHIFSLPPDGAEIMGKKLNGSSIHLLTADQPINKKNLSLAKVEKHLTLLDIRKDIDNKFGQPNLLLGQTDVQIAIIANSASIASLYVASIIAAIAFLARGRFRYKSRPRPTTKRINKIGNLRLDRREGTTRRKRTRMDSYDLQNFRA